MRNQLQVRSTHFSFRMSMWKCAIALLCCAFSIEPLFAQEVDWAYFGHDVDNQRYADIDLINLSNVSQLTVAWHFTGDATEAVSTESTPIVVDGVMYVSGNNSGVFALNPTTGKQIWHYIPSPAVPANTNRGVVYGQGLIFLGQSYANLVALNAKTGAVVWKTRADPLPPSGGISITMTPQYIVTAAKVPEVIVGVANSDFGTRCHLDAFNATTGKFLWRFYTVDPATFAAGAGNEYLIGGGGVWQTPTFDPTLNMVYVGVGNAGGPTFLGTNREGTNLYSASIIALDATSGELQWFFQMVHHDIWDFDSSQPTMLFDWNGVPAIEGNTKAAYNFILDRASGESLFPYQEVAVPPTPASAAFQHPWPTQPVSSIESLAEHQVEPGTVPPGAVAVPEFSTPGPTMASFQPNAGAGYEWYPAAYSPRTHMMYSHALYSPWVVSTTDNFDTVDCQSLDLHVLAYFYCGTTLGTAFGVSHGVYGAINTETGRVAWSIPIVTSAPSSGMTVAGDLVFFADATGLMYAANAATGEILWVYDALTVPGAGGASSTGAAVYEIGGVEYVASEFGGSGLIAGNALIAFALPSSKGAAAAKAKTK
jgi:quinohemoprotein ethanol dehydrogenase